MLGTILNNIGIFGAMAYFNIKLGSITEKKEVKRYVLGMVLIFIIAILSTMYIKPTSQAMTLVLTYGSYIMIMKVWNNRNFFYSLFEIIYSLLNTVLAQTAFIGLYMIPKHITLEQLEQSIFPQAVVSVFSVLTYIVVSKLIGKNYLTSEILFGINIIRKLSTLPFA